MDDDDPVIAEYDVYITPEQLESQLYVLQYLNRRPNQPFSPEDGTVPTQVRIKEQSGFIEVDAALPLENFNRRAGVKWGESLRKTKQMGQKAYGLASGFERAMPRTRAAAGAEDEAAPAQPNIVDDDDADIDDYVNNFDDAKEKGHVLNKQTYGGQIQKDDGNGPIYMAGTFRNNELHLTRIDGIVPLRTQFHHLDATAQLEAVKRRREKEEKEGTKPVEPKAFLPTVKKAGGDTPAEITQAFMKSANAEKWSVLDYHHSDESVSYDLYYDRLFYKDTASAPQLHSSMTSEQYLDAISAPSGGKGMKKKVPQRRQELVEISDESDSDHEHTNKGKQSSVEKKDVHEDSLQMQDLEMADAPGDMEEALETLKTTGQQ